MRNEKPSFFGSILKVDIGQMLRHRPGASVTSAGAAGIRTFHMMAMPTAGQNQSRPASAKPKSSSAVCSTAQTLLAAVWAGALLRAARKFMAG